MRFTGRLREDAKNILLYILENDGRLKDSDIQKAFPNEKEYVSTSLEKLHGQRVIKHNGSYGYEIDLDQATGKGYITQDEVRTFGRSR